VNHNPIYREAPLAGWDIPPIGLGTAAWGPPYPPVPRSQAIEVCQFALDQGLAFFDTAPKYSSGKSEAWLGMVLKGVPRSQFIISTKVAYPNPQGVLRNKQEGNSARPAWTREGVLRSVETSLKRLGLSTIDILHLHDPDWTTENDIEVAYPTMVELRDQGLVRAIGVGVNHWEILEKFMGQTDFNCFLLAGRYTLLEHKSLDFLNRCQAHRIPNFLGGVYNSGILATGAIPGARYNYREATPEIIEQVRRIETICTRHRVPLHAAALQFPLAHPAVKSLVIGASSRAEFAAALSGQSLPIPPQLWEDLRQEGLLPDSVPVPGAYSLEV
jgi:D-threo-aldose 1-dehydrogenase